MTYYTAIPLWKDNSRNLFIEGWGPTAFMGDSKIVRQKFSSIKDALIAAKNDGTALRPANYEKNFGWEFAKHSGLFSWCKTIISLEWLTENRYLEEISGDNISKIYKVK